MPIRRSQKKRNAENHRSVVIDPMVNPGSSAHRHQARSRADPTRTHHRMVTMAQSSPGERSAGAPQSKTTTVMLRAEPFEAVGKSLKTLDAFSVRSARAALAVVFHQLTLPIAKNT
ncbi:MAG: hypothetical protein WB420_11245 [Bradyrhizobium sp.]